MAWKPFIWWMAKGHWYISVSGMKSVRPPGAVPVMTRHLRKQTGAGTAETVQGGPVFRCGATDPGYAYICFFASSLKKEFHRAISRESYRNSFHRAMNRGKAAETVLSGKMGPGMMRKQPGEVSTSSGCFLYFFYNQASDSAQSVF